MASEMAARVGGRIRERREELGLTQQALASRVSEPVNGQRISDWERGVNLPSERYWPELVVALEVGDAGFFYATPEGKPTQLDRVEQALADLQAQVESLLQVAARRVSTERAPAPPGALGRVVEGSEPSARGPARKSRRPAAGSR